MSHDPYRARRRWPTRPLADDPGTGPVHVHAHVDRYPPFVNAGAEWMLHALMRHLVEQGHRATVTTAVDQRAIVDGVEVHPQRWADRLADACDVMVGHLLWTKELIELAGRHQRPLLYIVHNDSQVRSWNLRPWDVTALVHNSEWVAARHGWWDGPQFVVRPPCRLADYRVRRSPDGGSITLVNPNPDKGAELFYRLAAQFPGRRFIAVGGAYGSQRIPNVGTPNVEWQPPTGRIADDVYRRTRLLLVPSRYESWGRVAVEAMCSGIPVLAHPTPGLLEALGDAAMFLDRDDEKAWRSTIVELDEPSVYRAWSERATARAEELDRQAVTDLAAWERLVLRCLPAREEARV